MDKPSVPKRVKADDRLWSRQLMIAAFFISLSWKVAATSVSSSSTCSNHFVGKVINMAESSTPFSSIEKVKLDFHVRSRIKGDNREYEEVFYPKNGLKHFKVGDTYEVKLKDGLLCSLNKV